MKSGLSVLVCFFRLTGHMREISYRYSRTPVTRTRIFRTLPTNSNLVSIPLDLTQLFSHFHSVNLNLDNSNTPLTRTVFYFPSEFELPGIYCICMQLICVFTFHSISWILTNASFFTCVLRKRKRQNTIVYGSSSTIVKYAPSFFPFLFDI